MYMPPVCYIANIFFICFQFVIYCNNWTPKSEFPTMFSNKHSVLLTPCQTRLEISGQRNFYSPNKVSKINDHLNFNSKDVSGA